MAPKVERVVDAVALGEGPHWDALSQSLYFVDITGKSIHKYVSFTKKHTKACIGTDKVTLIVPVEGARDKFLISVGRQLVVVTWDGESDQVSNTEKLVEVEKADDTRDNRFNDGKCDSSGRLWAGTMGGEPVNGTIIPNKGALYSLEPNKSVKCHLSRVGISNGLTWSANQTKFYHIDTHKGTVDQYDFDINNAKIDNPRQVFTLSQHGIPGALDGMTIDTDGNLWIAIWDGYCVIKIDPRQSETLLDTIKIPAQQVSSVAFGGPNLDELYVTTAAKEVDGHILEPPYHGATYVVKGTGSRGFPGVSVRL